MSDQPVVPSFGLIASTGFLSALRMFSWYGQVVPMTMSLFAYDWICFA